MVASSPGERTEERMPSIADIASFLGMPASEALRSPLLADLEFERSVETDLPEIIVEYVCEERGVEVHADADERVQTVFLTRRDASPFAHGLRDLPFSWTQSEVRDHLGVPERGGPRYEDPILGVYGPWDRFARDGHSIHVRFDLDRGEITRITFMRSDIVP